MSRIDWIVLRRVAARLFLTLAIFFGLFALVESLDTYRFTTLSKIGGPQLALFAIVTGALRSTLGTLPVTVLIGTIIAVLDLQARREMTVIKATGTSVWRAMRMPLVAAVVIGVVMAVAADPLAILASRLIPNSGPARIGVLWLEQHSPTDGDYILRAEHARTNGTVLDDVALFFAADPSRERIEADGAVLKGGAWHLTNAVRYAPDTPAENLTDFAIATGTTPGDMRIRLTSARDLTFIELLTALSQQMADPQLRAAALTSLLRLVAMPALLVGSVLMGFAFTAGYRRTNKYGGAVLYGIVLGFVVYVVTELANRSGFAGVLDPTFAAAGPAFVAIVIGLTVLLYKEDGRA
jgi:lipopolysaccharide export system permease protein